MITSFGLSFSRIAGPSPIFSITPGRKFSKKRSADGTSDLMISDACGFPRSRQRLFLFPRVNLPVRADAFGFPGAKRVALGRLDLDHLRVEVSKYLRADVAREEAREVEDPDSFQRPSILGTIIPPMKSRVVFQCPSAERAVTNCSARATIARALTRNGSSIIWPSTTKAPTPFVAASLAAARMRRALSTRLDAA